MTQQVPREIVMPDGEIYVPALMRIVTRADESDIPFDLILCKPGRPIESVTGDEYLIAFINQKQLEEKT